MMEPTCGRQLLFLLAHGRLWSEYSTGIKVLQAIFEKRFWNIQNGTYSPNSCIPHAGSSLLVGLSVCIRSLVISTLWEYAPFTWESVSDGFVICFAAWIMARTCILKQTSWVKVCLILETSFCLCSRSLQVQNVSARDFCPQERLFRYNFNIYPLMESVDSQLLDYTKPSSYL